MTIKKIIHVILLWGAITNTGSAQIKLHITTGFTSPVSDFYSSVLVEADRRMSDVSISFEVLPAERSLVLVDEGVNDAECCRAPEVLIKEYKNLIPIDVSFFSVRFSVFSKNKDISIKNFENLKPYSIGTVKGWKLAVIKLKEVEPAETHVVTTPAQLFKMLDQDRVDYGVVGYLSGLKVISQFKFDSIHAIQPPLIEKPLFLILNKKHKNLIPRFNQVFNEMKTDGTINRIYNELVDSL